jgi:hypothetical protein
MINSLKAPSCQGFAILTDSSPPKPAKTAGKELKWALRGPRA